MFDVMDAGTTMKQFRKISYEKEYYGTFTIIRYLTFSLALIEINRT